MIRASQNCNFTSLAHLQSAAECIPHVPLCPQHDAMCDIYRVVVLSTAHARTPRSAEAYSPVSGRYYPFVVFARVSAGPPKCSPTRTQGGRASTGRRWPSPEK